MGIKIRDEKPKVKNVVKEEKISTTPHLDRLQRKYPQLVRCGYYSMPFIVFHLGNKQTYRRDMDDIIQFARREYFKRDKNPINFNFTRTDDTVKIDIIMYYNNTDTTSSIYYEITISPNIYITLQPFESCNSLQSQRPLARSTMDPNYVDGHIDDELEDM